MPEIVQPSVTLWKCDDERLIEQAGRVCYDSTPNGENSHVKFIKTLICVGHDSVLEHCSATFLIVCDRGISHELVRHRHASFCQESTRYVDQTNACVIAPSEMSKNNLEAWRSAVNTSLNAYAYLREHDCTRETARAILPTCLATRIVMTANFREWRHILKLRLDKAAHPDMRLIMEKTRDHLIKNAPATFADFKEPTKQTQPCTCPNESATEGLIRPLRAAEKQMPMRL